MRARHRRRECFRRFPSAKAWFNWSGGGALAKCDQTAAASAFRKDGYKVSDLRRFREEVPLYCDQCPAHVVRAWRISMRISKPGDETTWFEDIVSVRMEYVEINFAFESNDFSFTGTEEVVGEVLDH